ncbi:ABC transporter [Streptomyces sp. NPDC047072]|uniref:ABC transporter n=1 Tax=Streptomyces sp. NPDC047072 TaxID=3154809 RepID=UPI003407EDBB
MSGGRLSGRLAWALALAWAVARGVPWRVVGVGAVGGAGVVAVVRWMGGAMDPWLGINLLRAAALVFALGLAFLLDDPARHTTAPVPARRWVRAGLRVGLVLPVAALWWTAVLALVPEQARPPVGAVTLEAAAVAALALAGAAVTLRFTDEPEPGPSVAAGLLTVAVVAPLLTPARWSLLVAPGDPRWEASHTRWAWLLAAAALVWAACEPEPLQRRALRNGTRPRPVFGRETSLSGRSDG